MHIASIAIGRRNTGKGMEYILYCIQKFCSRNIIEHGNLMAWLYCDIYWVAKGCSTPAMACHLLWYTAKFEGGVWQYSQYRCLCTVYLCMWQTHTGSRGKWGVQWHLGLTILSTYCVLGVSGTCVSAFRSSQGDPSTWLHWLWCWKETQPGNDFHYQWKRRAEWKMWQVFCE